MTRLAPFLALALLASCRTVPPALIDVQETQTEIATQAATIEGTASTLASDTEELAGALDALPVPEAVKVQARTVDATAARLAALSAAHTATIERQTAQIAKAARAEVALVADLEAEKGMRQRADKRALIASIIAAVEALGIAAYIVARVRGWLKI